MIQKTISKVVAGLALVGALAGGYLLKGQSAKTADVRVQDKMVEVQSHKGLLPSGAGVLLKDKKIVLIPEMTENREQYEKRMVGLNQIAPQTGYTFVSIIDQENKAAYDGFMMDFMARQGKIYNMILNPRSSWASMQLSGADFVKKYTPYDILKAQQQGREKVAGK